MTEAAKRLESCEHELRELAAQAVKAGDYTAVRRLTDWAETIRALIPDVAAGSTARKQGTSQPRLRLRAGEYPRFFRNKDDLVKIGWSKTAKEEYHHYAPRRVVDALVEAVKLASAGGKVFTSNDLFPLRDESVGNNFPDYQVYLALAWLRQLGLIESKGRRGAYTLQSDEPIESAVADAWRELEQWRG